ncbi:polyisoprenoid-binding protein [Roseobacter cerasinus]|uniref:Polyisoprenoid-binding protein n=1 Tax=Roseobacter cerasinus TaxID=2602289 RepID=A0A640VSC6_9RHOB|nr:YceI family protein [Roseobacter cerasinus]GFE50330.1 polyisoprenoid-binding protein [Roseobacter cerasinus]
MPLMLSRRFLIAAGLASCATRGMAAPQRYALVQDRSRVAFLFDLSGATQVGTVPVSSADIRVDLRRLARSSADVSADIRGARTGMIFITQALLSAQVLDAANHPMVRYQSRRVILGRDGRISEGARIAGDLTLRGVTQPLDLNATLTRPPGSAADDLSVLNIRLTGTLSRSAFGAVGYSNLVADAVDLDITAEIRRDA